MEEEEEVTLEGNDDSAEEEEFEVQDDAEESEEDIEISDDDIDSLIESDEDTLLAGRFKSVGDLANGYLEVERYKNRVKAAADAALQPLGYRFDEKTGRYYRADAGTPEIGSRAPEQPAAPGATAQRPEPLQFLDSSFLDREADGRYGYGQNNWPLDRYGNEVIPIEKWEEFGVSEGWSDLTLRAEYESYRNSVTESRRVGFEREQNSERQHIASLAAQQENEKQAIVSQFSEKFVFAPPEQAAGLAKIFIGEAEELIKNAIANGSISERQARAPDYLGNVVFALTVDSLRQGTLMAKVNQVAEEQKRGKAASNGKVVSTRLVTPQGEAGAGPGAVSAAPASNGNGSVYSKLPDALKREVDKVANDLGIRDKDRLARDFVTGRRRRR